MDALKISRTFGTSPLQIYNENEPEKREISNEKRKISNTTVQGISNGNVNATLAGAS